MGVWDTVKRIGTGAATGGLSEVYKYGKDNYEGRLDNAYAGVDRNNFNVPGYQGREDELKGLQYQLGNRGALQAQGGAIGPYAQSGEGGFRQDQGALAAMLMRQAQGQDSMAAQQLRQYADQNIAQQQALAASARPGMGAMASRMAAQNAGRINQGLAGQTEMAQIAERLGASQALGGVLQGARGLDVNQSQFNAGMTNQQLLEQARLQQQNNQFNVGAYQNQTGMNDAAIMEMLRQRNQLAQLQQQGGMGYEQVRAGKFGAATNVPSFDEMFLSGASNLGAGLATGGA